MAAAAYAEVRLALTGALRLARGDARGLDCFNQTEEGFWHSFRAAVLCYPLYLILLSFPIQVGDTVVEVDVGRYFAVETIHFVISWVAFPLLMLPLVDRLGRSQRYFGFMVAYNWCQVPQTLVFAFVALLGTHDFSAFRAAECQAKSPVKTLDALDVTRAGEEIHIEARARSFLHHQVRNMAGTLKLVGLAQWTPDDVAAALEARDRRAGGPTAPAAGLYLVEVNYG